MSIDIYFTFEKSSADQKNHGKEILLTGDKDLFPEEIKQLQEDTCYKW